MTPEMKRGQQGNGERRRREDKHGTLEGEMEGDREREDERRKDGGEEKNTVED